MSAWLFVVSLSWVAAFNMILFVCDLRILIILYPYYSWILMCYIQLLRTCMTASPHQIIIIPIINSIIIIYNY